MTLPEERHLMPRDAQNWERREAVIGANPTSQRPHESATTPREYTVWVYYTSATGSPMVSSTAITASNESEARIKAHEFLRSFSVVVVNPHVMIVEKK